MARTSFRPAARRGFSRLDLFVVIAIGIVGSAFLLSMLGGVQSARTNSFQNTCRNNLSNLAKSLFSYANRNGGRLPGYINTLNRKDGSLYIDPESGKATPVSWTVEILTDIDRQSLYEQWQKVRTPVDVRQPDESPTTSTKLYIDMLVCPNDPATQKSGTPISYVVNTGLTDAPISKASPDSAGPDGAEVPGIPRDWQANGVFLDRYTDDPRVTTDAKRRPPKIVTRFDRMRRPKDKIIMVTENVDAGDYTLDADRDSADDWRRAEVNLGATWSADIVGPDGQLRKRPLSPALHLNERTGEGDGQDIRFARPSSRHPGLINVAYVGQNVQSLRDTIDYYVYAKLMTTDDNPMHPGTRDPIEKLGAASLTDADINP
ncbi:MAG: DUF1559 domain-containing protein [Planctomycetales bacterium]|nr:DUF1559 domain-containing protein [Planctomycetales bacterium]MBN8625994.1 DUF1559 domain-containing protein [Planctomycetota bacterium]